MDCHRCGACCTHISISSPIPGLPGGKPAGVRCPHLGDDNLCGLFHDARRPAVCGAFRADPEMCGSDGVEAGRLIQIWERATAPTL